MPAVSRSFFQTRFRLVSFVFVFFCTSLSGRAQFVQQGDFLQPDVTTTFGTSLALSADGNTAIVGAPQETSFMGGAWVYSRVQGTWTQSAHLVGTGAVPTPVPGPNNFVGYFVLQGTSVALSADGNTALVGGPSDNNILGATWVFVRNNGVWTQQGTKLVGMGASGQSLQGYAAALSADGDTAIVGGFGDNYNGAAWVFVRVNGSWTQQGSKLVGVGGVSGPQQGHAVALSADGNTAILGGFWDNAFVGAAWIFARENGVWAQQGDKLIGRGAHGAASQGFSVALSGDGNTAVVGGPNDNGNVGAAWIFGRSNGVWSQLGSKVVGLGGVAQESRGISVAISGDAQTLLVGGVDNKARAAAWVFANANGTWRQEGTELTGTDASETHQVVAVSISADGDTALISGYANDPNGAVWPFIRRAATTSSLSSSAPNGYVGSTITFTCRVTGQAWTGVPAGSVTLLDYGSPIPLASAVLDNTGAADIVPTLSAGIHRIRCTFDPSDRMNLASTSPAITEVVTKAPAHVTINADATQAKVGQPVTFSVSLAPVPGVGTPTGTIGLWDGSQFIGNVVLANGQATLTTSFTTTGTHKIVAGYNGDSNYFGGLSGTTVQVVN